MNSNMNAGTDDGRIYAYRKVGKEHKKHRKFVRPVAVSSKSSSTNHSTPSRDTSSSRYQRFDTKIDESLGSVNYKIRAKQSPKLNINTNDLIRTHPVSHPLNSGPSSRTDEGYNHNKFSLRNSLRHFTGENNPEQTQSDNMPFNAHHMIDARRALQNHFGFGDLSKYEKLTSHSMIKIRDSHYYCLLCQTKARLSDELDSTHSQSRNHSQRYFELLNSIIDVVPDDTSLHMRSLQILLNDWALKHTLNVEMIELRNAAINDFYLLLQEMRPECSCRVIGSFATGTSLSTSDVDLELIHPNSAIFESDPRAKHSIHHKLTDPDAEYGSQFNNHTVHYDLIPNAIDTLYMIGISIQENYTAHRYFKVLSCMNDLNSRRPKLRLKHQTYGIELEITCYAESSHRMANLLRLYLSLDERAKILSILVKYWARYCQISSLPGTYSPETFVILVIYFLQRTQPPILPCLHEILKGSNRKDENDSEKSNVDECNGIINQFERLLLNDNGVSLTKQFDDGENTGTRQEGSDNIRRSNMNQDRNEIDEEDDDILISDQDIASDDINWTTSNRSDIHTLFIQFMQFMIGEFGNCASVISIRTLETVSLASKHWNSQVKAVEDPIRPRCNLSKDLGSHRTYNYIRDCFRHAYYYLTSIPIGVNLKPIDAFIDDPRELICLYVDSDRLDFYLDMKKAKFKTRCPSNSPKPLYEMIQQRIFFRDVEVISRLIDHSITNNVKDIPRIVANRFNSRMLIPPDINATRFCELCKKCGHLRDRCPEGALYHLDPAGRDLALDTQVNLDTYFLQMYHSEIITEALSKQHQEIIQDLTSIINGMGLDCTLTFFGSTVNRLGSYDSDLDICMTLKGDKTGVGLNCVDILNNVCQVLRNFSDVEEMEPILSARVPILKFKYKNFYIDLSMYNQCAIYNSKLLRAYTMIDPRLAQLFYIVKKYAKVCGIADASRGSLSSYAWSLLVIHFLQRTDPPILPVLQETHFRDSRPLYDKKKMFGVNGWNVWFNDDVESIRMTPCNNMSLTSLFKQFLEYYSGFDFELNIVSIRTRDLITRFKKNWTNCMIAIEDPFELTYNLSSRLDDLMATYILNSFRGAYNQIVKLQTEIITKQTYLTRRNVENIFDIYRITGQREPPYRGCRICHRVGHKERDCQAKRKNGREKRRHA